MQVLTMAPCRYGSIAPRVRLCMQVLTMAPSPPQVLFRAEICVISSLSEDYCHVVKPPDVWKVELRARLYLGHFAEYHYVSTRPVSNALL